MLKRLGGIIGCKDKTSSCPIRFPLMDHGARNKLPRSCCVCTRVASRVVIYIYIYIYISLFVVLRRKAEEGSKFSLKTEGVSDCVAIRKTKNSPRRKRRMRIFYTVVFYSTMR